jgi:hypothetical protein
MEPTDNIQELILAFLRGELSESELENFTILLKNHPELEKEVKEFKELTSVLDADSWAITQFDNSNDAAKEYFKFYTDKKNQAYFQYLKSMDIEGNKKTEKQSLKVLWSSLAVAAILILGVFLFKPNEKADATQLFSAYINTDEIPSFAERGGQSDSILILIETLFQQKRFEAVNELILNHQSDFNPETIDLISIYQGVAYGETAQYQNAVATFSNPEIFKYSIYQPMANWYLALYLLKSEQIIEAKIQFMEIAENSNHYKQKEALEILKKMK